MRRLMIMACALLAAAHLWADDGAGDSPAAGGDFPAGGTPVAAGVPYGTESAAQVCDVFVPGGASSADSARPANPPLLVLVRGGSFAGEAGDGDGLVAVAEAALSRGYAVASVDWRTAAEAAFPAAVLDVKAAIHFLRANAREYGFDGQKIAVWGTGAGGYLAVMAALTPGAEFAGADGAAAELRANAGISEEVQALVAFGAPVEFYTVARELKALGREDDAELALRADADINTFLGFVAGKKRKAAGASHWKTYHAAPKKLRAWICAGTADGVPYTQSLNLATRLKARYGASSVHLELPQDARTDNGAPDSRTLDAALDFLDKSLRGKR